MEKDWNVVAFVFSSLDFLIDDARRSCLRFRLSDVGFQPRDFLQSLNIRQQYVNVSILSVQIDETCTKTWFNVVVSRHSIGKK